MSKTSPFFSKLFQVNKDFAKEAAILSKADLVSDMVGEFPELQGIMGGYYSQLKGHPKEVSDAIFEHYKPKGILDTLPQTKLGCLLSLIDKVDTLTGFFIINKQPTGSKDPFALRRTGFAIVQILITHDLSISVNDIFIEPFKSYDDYSEKTHNSLNNFIIDKIKFILNKQNQSGDIVESVMSLKDSPRILIPILVQRIKLLEKIRDDEKFKNFLIGFKRIHNILNNSDSKIHNDDEVNENLLEKKEEHKLLKIIKLLEDEINKFEGKIDNQQKIIDEFLNLEKIIGSFFDNVIVNHEDNNLKSNRLALLNKLSKNIKRFAKFEVIAD